MSPLALYIEQVLFHEPQFTPSEHPVITIYPPSPPANEIFDSIHSAPVLEKNQINWIITYCGSFNPPHRGHLHLLKHAFTRGTHDLNVIAAIILPRSDESVARKVREEDGNFMFGYDERCLLWKKDLCFPPWAWVYDCSTASSTQFLEHLKEATGKDGYSIEVIPLYGTGIASPHCPPDPIYNCKRIMMTDAARAAAYQRSSGRLENFNGCTKWAPIAVQESQIYEDHLRSNITLKANRRLLDMQTICPQEARSMLEDGEAYVKEAVETDLSRATEDLKSVMMCERHMGNQTIKLRFVKCDDTDPRADYNDISSTSVRKIMNKEKGIKLREALDWMVLSADLLWRYRSSWIDKATLGAGSCIKFNEPRDELQLPEAPELYEEPPSFDDPPTLEELGLAKVSTDSSPVEEEVGLPESFKKSPAVDKSSTLEQPALQDISPTAEDLQSLKRPHSLSEPLPPDNKKRRFSATGLEENVEVLGHLAGSGIPAKVAKTEKPGSCQF